MERPGVGDWAAMAHDEEPTTTNPLHGPPRRSPLLPLLATILMLAAIVGIFLLITSLQQNT